MAEIQFMSGSGLVALHSIALLLRGEELPDPEYGWEAFSTLDRPRRAVFRSMSAAEPPTPGRPLAGYSRP